MERLIEIDLPDDEIDVAIDSYIRHSTESWRLAREGEYTADDWLDFYGQLRARWDLIRLRNRRIAQQNAWPPEKQGYHILEETTYREFCGPLGGEPTTYPYFTQGGYHRLADEDRVWWSPNYVPLTGDANEED